MQTSTMIDSILERVKVEDFVKCRPQRDWICDSCGKCGDRDCCPGTHTLYRIPRSDDSLCSDCLKNLQSVTAQLNS